ncbi:hypothetical protein [Microbacterium candidum]|uniref:Uncharacterized protein n=1 Tax=Microbacterium candidum TaxID=3041922 RepID=A0ABT7MWL8_9MICO|nr:hypothetical protein [Microbacterium sp. ASV49]MDL9978847.1 hypothetical protein [Microbacterium sp. ASV49]
MSTDWAAIPALSKFHVRATEKALDDIRKPTALIRQQSIAVSKAAPVSHSDVGILVTLISHFQDPDMAADALEDAVPAALEYYRTHYVQTETATAVAYANRSAYDIPVTVIAHN